MVFSIKSLKQQTLQMQQYLKCSQAGSLQLLQKFYPHIIQKYSLLKAISLPLKTQAPCQQLQIYLRDIQLYFKHNPSQFLQILALAPLIDPFTLIIDQIKILEQAAFLSMHDIFKFSQVAVGEMVNLSKICLELAYDLVLKHEQKLFHIDHKCLDIGIRQYESKYKIVLGIRNEVMVVSLNKEYKKGQYAKLFRDYNKILITKATKNVEFKSIQIVNTQILNQHINTNILLIKDILILKQQKHIKEQQQIYYILENIWSLQVTTLFQFSKNLLQSKTRLYNKIVQQKQKLINKNFDWHPLQFKDSITSQQIVGPIYSNPICPHFQGFCKTSIVQVYKKCNKCGATLVADPTKLYLYQNQFMTLLQENPLNPLRKMVIYSFKNYIFLTERFNNYLNYSHYAQILKKSRLIKDRPDLMLNLNLQKLFLANNVYSESKLVNKKLIIKTPVRGLYCKHVGFYDLAEVYRQQMSKPEVKFFECFICMQNVSFSDIIYLQEIKILLDWLVKKGFINNEEKLLQLIINHEKKELKLVHRKKKEVLMQKVLPFYEAMMDPRTDFRDEQQQKQYQKALLDDYNDLSKYQDRSDSDEEDQDQ